MSIPFSRRRFIGAALSIAALAHSKSLLQGAESAAAAPTTAIDDIPIIDTHIHLFDPTRPQGVPWPEAKNTLIYRPTLPDRFRQLAAPFNVRGAIEVEASPWLEDNQWVLDVSEKDTIMVGTIGNLEPGKPEFAHQLERFQRHPLFRGIRYGNLWGRNLGDGLKQPEFIADLNRLAQAGLVLDTANPNPQLLAEVVRLTDLLPTLRIVLDHLPSLRLAKTAEGRASYEASLKALADRPQVYVKISAVLRPDDDPATRNAEFHRSHLDEIYGVFGPDRVLFGSDWPNSVPAGTYAEILGLVRVYFASKGRVAAEKYFWKNSVAAYHWVKREAGQPS